MKKTLLLSIVAVNMLMADDIAWLRDTFQSGKINGQVRAGLIKVAFDKKEQIDERAFSLGAKVHLETSEAQKYGAGVTGYTSNSLGFNDRKKDKVNGDFFDADKKSYTILGEAYFRANISDTTIKIGRQELDTPLMNSDDIRMIPNTFSGILATNTTIKDLTLSAGYFNKMSGWESAVGPERFGAIQTAAEIQNDDGIAFVSATYEGVENVNLQFWNYYITNVVNALYLEAGYKFNFNGVDFGVGGQYQFQADIGDKVMGAKKAFMVGLNAFATLQTNTTLNIAFNDGNDDELIEAWGGAPMFTSYFDNLTPVNGKNAQAYAGGVEQDLSNFGLNGALIGAYYGVFKADNFDKEEFDIVLGYEKEPFSVDGVIVFLEDNTNTGADSYTGYVLRANYNF